MYSPTKLQIVEFIKKNGHAQAKELVAHLSLTQAAIHRALNYLIDKKVLIKKGKTPKVFYFLNHENRNQTSVLLSKEDSQTLEDHYLYMTPTGKVETGVSGFLNWMKTTQNKQAPEKCIQDYIQILNESLSHKDKKLDLIDATDRFHIIFKKCNLDQVYYHDFYSLIKFGKTKLGNYLLHGKQAQDKAMIQKIAEIIAPQLINLIEKEKIEAIAWTPHSIPRKIPFLKELEKRLSIQLPKVEVLKVSIGEVPIAQKSLAKIEERIQNARETMIVVPQKISFKKILLVDDAVGSGATLNEISEKLKFKGADKVIGYALVGSYKGFEVLKEI